jgi:putative transposase
MRQLNGVYTQRFNRCHRRVGHVFQGRYHGVLVQKDAYLLELTRYVVLNPVRAAMVRQAVDWPWSSYRATVGKVPAPGWLEVDWLLAQFGSTRNNAVRAYIRFVDAGIGAASPWEALKYQVFLGDDGFAERFRNAKPPEQLSEIPKTQRRPLAGKLDEYFATHSRDEAMYLAYASGVYSMKEIGDFLNVHYMTVSRAVRRFEQHRMLECETLPWSPPVPLFIESKNETDGIREPAAHRSEFLLSSRMVWCLRSRSSA